MDADRPLAFQIPTDNRPAPLLGAGVGFLEDETWQMSFGERAALVGLLAALRPRIAVEVGTYEGGSLRVLAAAAQLVYTIDLFELVPDLGKMENVVFRRGDSSVLLPQLMEELAGEGREVDLALIDGDHSADGVHRDLSAVLDAPTAPRVILLHDTMNPEVRAGIERAELSAHPCVVYHELDFVPGYEFSGGHFDGQVWGGLGLVVTGERSLSGYGGEPRQSRYREPFGLLHAARGQGAELDAARGQLEELRGELERSRRVMTAMQSSPSWRITAPLRALKRTLAKRRAG